MLDFLLFLDFYVGTACNQAFFFHIVFLSLQNFKTTIQVNLQYSFHEETNIKMGIGFQL